MKNSAGTFISSGRISIELMTFRRKIAANPNNRVGIQTKELDLCRVLLAQNWETKHPLNNSGRIASCRQKSLLTETDIKQSSFWLFDYCWGQTEESLRATRVWI